jgi:hypothetical protein
LGTVFEETHLPLRLWLQVIHLMNSSKKGISTRQIQRLLNCSMETAWFLTHRVREMMKPASGGQLPPLGGSGATLEADETYVGGEAVGWNFRSHDTSTIRSASTFVARRTRTPSRASFRS